MRKIVLLRDAGYLFSSDAAMIALGLLGQIILTHSLPTAEYGSWVIVIDLLGILFLLVHFGIPDVLGRDAPRIASRIARILKFYTSYQLATALVFGPIVIMILLTFLSPGLSLYTTIFLAISVASQLLGATYRMILRSLGEARIEGFLRILDRSLVITGYVINHSFLGGSIEVFAIATAIGPFSTLPLAIWKSRSLLAGIPPAGKSSVAEGDFSRRELLFRALPFFITSGLLLVINRVDKIVLIYFTGPEAVAIFNVGWLCYFAGCAVPQAFMSILLPGFGSIRGDDKLVEKTTRHSYSILEWFIPPGILVGSLVAFFAIPYLFPVEYSSWNQQLGGSAVSVFFVLLSAWTMITLAAPFFANIQAGEDPWIYTSMGVVMILVDLISAIILVPSFGIMGAAWATVVTRAVTLAFLFFYSDGFSLYPDIGIRILILGAFSLAFSITSTMVLGDSIPKEYLVITISSMFILAGILGWRPSYIFREIKEMSTS